MFKKDSYWTLPLDYSEMRENSPTLYSELAKSDLLIFKGKPICNYTKLNTCSLVIACIDIFRGSIWIHASAQHFEVHEEFKRQFQLMYSELSVPFKGEITSNYQFCYNIIIFMSISSSGPCRV